MGRRTDRPAGGGTGTPRTAAPRRWAGGRGRPGGSPPATTTWTAPCWPSCHRDTPRRRPPSGGGRRAGGRRSPGCGPSCATCCPPSAPTRTPCWADDPHLAHSMLSTSLNLGLLLPGEVVDAAEEAYRQGPGAHRLGRGLRAPGDRVARVRVEPVLGLARPRRRQRARPRRPRCRPPSPARRPRTCAAWPPPWTTCAATAGCTTSPA